MLTIDYLKHLILQNCVTQDNKNISYLKSLNNFTERTEKHHFDITTTWRVIGNCC